MLRHRIKIHIAGTSLAGWFRQQLSIIGWTEIIGMNIQRIWLADPRNQIPENWDGSKSWYHAKIVISGLAKRMLNYHSWKSIGSKELVCWNWINKMAIKLYFLEWISSVFMLSWKHSCHTEVLVMFISSDNRTSDCFHSKQLLWAYEYMVRELNAVHG